MKARNTLLLVVWSVLMLLLGMWITSPKSPGFTSLCGHFPLCPDPLVYFRNMERQPSWQGTPTGLNVVAGGEREVTLTFDVSGLPEGTSVQVVEVSRSSQHPQGGDFVLSATPQAQRKGVVLYRDPELTVTSETHDLRQGKLMLTLRASEDARPGVSILQVEVQKGGTRWGSKETASFQLRVQPAGGVR